MTERVKEWIAQSDYDLDTAEYMQKGGRNIYAVFMCHLAVEKALKGLYEKKLGEASIPTRYPDDLAAIQKIYTGEITKDILAKSRETVKWIKAEL